MSTITAKRARRPVPAQQQPARPPRVFTYARVSTKRQAKEDKASFERQERYARAYADKQGLVLDEDTRFEDRGVSGFHGDNVKEGGALKRFLDAFDAGDVIPNDVLIVESFDRLSRQEPIDANEHFERLVRGGVVIVMSGKDGGDGREFSRAALRRDDTLLIVAKLEQSRAYRESERKQQLSREGISGKCRRWLEGKRGFRVTGSRNDPDWVTWNEQENRFDFVPHMEQGVRRAIELYRAGNGTPEVARVLAHEGLALSEKWPVTYLQKTIRNPSLVGTRELTVAGEEFVLRDYYPAIIGADEFDELQALVDRRGLSRGRSESVAVVTGLGIARCAVCGSPLVGQQLKRRLANGKPIRRIRCSHVATKAARCSSKMGSCLSEVLEKIVMDFCSTQANLDAMFNVTHNDGRMAMLAERRTELARLERKIGEYEKRMDDEDDPLTQTERKKLRQFEADRDAAVDEITQLEREMKLHVKRRVSTAKQWRSLVKGVIDLDPTARQEARKLVANTFERIDVWFKGDSQQDAHMMAVRLTGRNGVERQVLLDRRNGDIIAIREYDDVEYTVTTKTGKATAEAA
ncbi:recombinase family protein [Paraburkholderia acidiphila]|uniref:Recombinase domain-containing protein n=1 Tax=Paraburkholderia acidiphila TaxID=2571747 RepID=A0A7Z2J9V7_9BURK|nr:recombinase family protein [Paraburkholderia acidiphila]QGZ57187.1 hypothetical protein FAZ97_19870 [Paraburkholderia acidiphila]